MIFLLTILKLNRFNLEWRPFNHLQKLVIKTKNPFLKLGDIASGFYTDNDIDALYSGYYQLKVIYKEHLAFQTDSLSSRLSIGTSCHSSNKLML